MLIIKFDNRYYTDQSIFKFSFFAISVTIYKGVTIYISKFFLVISMNIRWYGINLPDGNIKDVAPDGGWDGHVAEALTSHDDGGDEVGDGSAGR